ncbi:MAG: hypothetical protein PVG79_13800 [Gemmatimonadales bacterium]|jgi:hypothetical protein
MNRQDPTRREFLLELARGATYAAPLIATFAVAPDLLAQGGSWPGHHQGMSASAPTTTSPEQPGAPPPSEKHPPPSQKQPGGQRQPVERKE